MTPAEMQAALEMARNELRLYLYGDSHTLARALLEMEADLRRLLDAAIHDIDACYRKAPCGTCVRCVSTGLQSRYGAGKGE